MRILPSSLCQEPNGNCSDKLVHVNFFILGGFFRVDFPLLKKRLNQERDCRRVICHATHTNTMRLGSFPKLRSKGSDRVMVIETSEPLKRGQKIGVSRENCRKVSKDIFVAIFEIFSPAKMSKNIFGTSRESANRALVKTNIEALKRLQM